LEQVFDHAAEHGTADASVHMMLRRFYEHAEIDQPSDAFLKARP